MRRPSVWTNKMSNGDIVATIVNWRELSYRDFSFDLSEIGVLPKAHEKVVVRDLWAHSNTNPDDYTNAHTVMYLDEIAGHGVKVYRFHIVE